MDDGPEPIIECNHKTPVVIAPKAPVVTAAKAPVGQAIKASVVTAAGDVPNGGSGGSNGGMTSSPPGAAAYPPAVHNSQNHGLLGMFQKHLGIGKQIASALKSSAHHGVSGVSMNRTGRYGFDCRYSSFYLLHFFLLSAKQPVIEGFDTVNESYDLSDSSDSGDDGDYDDGSDGTPPQKKVR